MSQIQVLLTAGKGDCCVFCMILALCFTSSDKTSGQIVNKISSKRTCNENKGQHYQRLLIFSRSGGYYGFKVTGMCKGLFWVGIFYSSVLFGKNILASIFWGNLSEVDLFGVFQNNNL